MKPEYIREARNTLAFGTPGTVAYRLSAYIVAQHDELEDLKREAQAERQRWLDRIERVGSEDKCR